MSAPATSCPTRTPSAMPWPAQPALTITFDAPGMRLSTGVRSCVKAIGPPQRCAERDAGQGRVKPGDARLEAAEGRGAVGAVERQLRDVAGVARHQARSEHDASVAQRAAPEIRHVEGVEGRARGEAERRDGGGLERLGAHRQGQRRGEPHRERDERRGVGVQRHEDRIGEQRCAAHAQPGWTPRLDGLDPGVLVHGRAGTQCGARQTSDQRPRIDGAPGHGVLDAQPGVAVAPERTERARRIAVDQLPAAGQREIAVDPGLGHDRRERIQAVLDAVQRAGGRALEHDASGPSAGAGAQRRRLEDDDARTASREMIRRQTAR